MKTKLIVFSGEQGCGKDTAIDHLLTVLPFKRAECKESLHTATMALFGVDEQTYWKIYSDRSRKSTPNTLFYITEQEAVRLREFLGGLKYQGSTTRKGFFPLTIREAIIYTSELVMKPMFGQDVFGLRRAQKLEKGGLYLDGSFGFVEELTPAIDKLGQENILGIRILGRSDGDIDSRVILPDGLLQNTVDIWNGEDVTLEEYLRKVRKEVVEWVL